MLASLVCHSSTPGQACEREAVVRVRSVWSKRPMIPAMTQDGNSPRSPLAWWHLAGEFPIPLSWPLGSLPLRVRRPRDDASSGPREQTINHDKNDLWACLSREHGELFPQGTEYFMLNWCTVGSSRDGPSVAVLHLTRKPFPVHRRGLHT